MTKIKMKNKKREINYRMVVSFGFPDVTLDEVKEIRHEIEEIIRKHKKHKEERNKLDINIWG